MTFVGSAPAGFRLSETSPFAYSTTNRLYVLNDTQTLLATYVLVTAGTVTAGDVTVMPFTVPSPCAPAGITSFAGVLP